MDEQGREGEGGRREWTSRGEREEGGREWIVEEVCG